MTEHPAGHAGLGAVSHEPLSALTTVRPGSVGRAAITEPGPALTAGELVAATVRVAGWARPAQLTTTLVVRRAGAVPVVATCRVTSLAAAHPVPLVARVTGTMECPGCVATGGLGVTVVEAEAALVNIRTGEILPLLWRLTGGLSGAGPIAPPTAQPGLAVRAGGEVRAAVAFLSHRLARTGEVRPVLATSELELAGVN